MTKKTDTVSEIAQMTLANTLSKKKQSEIVHEKYLPCRDFKR